MELFQELLFTISFSLIVSLLIAKLFSMAANYDDGDTSKPSSMVEEKIEKGWVVCDPAIEEKAGYFEDAVKVNDDSVGKIDEESFCRDFEVEAPSECVLETQKVVGVVDDCEVERLVFDESPERNNFDQKEVTLVEGDEVHIVEDDGEIKMGDREVERLVFDASPERNNVDQKEVNLVEGDGVHILEDVGEGKIEDSEVQRLVFDESPERNNYDQKEVNLVEADGDGVHILEDDGEGKIEEVHMVEDDGEGKIEEGFDDWEGIERTELEKVFGAAVAFVGSKSNADKTSLIDNDVKLQLYGLHKIATEGPCLGPPPMALKLSARANWNAWKRLENLGQQDAMEQYIALLSGQVADWMGTPMPEDKQEFSATVTSTNLPLDLETPGAENEIKLEQLNPSIGECVSTGATPNTITE